LSSESLNPQSRKEGSPNHTNPPGTTSPVVTASLARPVGTDRGTLEEAHVYWVWQMHRLSSDDYDATRVLMILEEALRHMSPASSRSDSLRP